MLKYLEDQFLYESKANIVDAIEDGMGVVRLELDSTIFYVKGGGQPCDIGIITSFNGKTVFEVDEVKFVEDKVYHFGVYKGDGKFSIGEDVLCQIDKERRVQNSKVHTLGHLIDEAMLNLGYYEYIKPSKGFHYPEGPNVEYKGDISQFDLEKIKKDVEDEVHRMIKIGFEVKDFFINEDEMEKYCHKITIDSSMLGVKDMRVVIVWGDKGITCGGTHVKNISDIEGITITKLVSKKGNIKVSYRLTQ